MIDLSIVYTKKRLRPFCEKVMELSNQIGFKVSSRGWGYLMEQQGWITKDQFDKVEGMINRARKYGLLPVDFVAEEGARKFEGVNIPDTCSLEDHVKSWLGHAYNCHEHFEPNWWDGEEYYIQMLVEKIDLVTLFQPICELYHIPIGNARGWSSILQRADYARRFAEAEEQGLKCVLLYCGDHDPDGVRISDTIRKNLEDIKDVYWEAGSTGYDPENLIIHRFGLEYKFIIKNKLTWIDNLITGNTQKKMDLGDPNHPNHNMDYVQMYLKKVGRRKCEANALVTIPRVGQALCQAAIEKYLGKDSRERFEERKQKTRDDILEVMDRVDIKTAIEEAIDKL